MHTCHVYAAIALLLCFSRHGQDIGCFDGYFFLNDLPFKWRRGTERRNNSANGAAKADILAAAANTCSSGCGNRYRLDYSLVYRGICFFLSLGFEIKEEADMSNLLKMERYQLLHNSFYLGGLTGIFLIGFFTADTYIPEVMGPAGGAALSLTDIFNGMVYDSTFLLIIISSILALILGQEFSCRTINQEICAGHSRNKSSVIK